MRSALSDRCRRPQPARDLRAVDAEHVGELRRRPEIGAERLDLRTGDTGMCRMSRNTICCATRTVAAQESRLFRNEWVTTRLLGSCRHRVEHVSAGRAETEHLQVCSGYFRRADLGNRSAFGAWRGT